MNSDDLRAVVREEMADMKDQIQRIDYAIRGNGVPGLNQRVGVLESAWTLQKKLWGAVLGIVCATATALVAKLID